MNQTTGGGTTTVTRLPSASRAGTATAIGCATTGPTSGSTRRAGPCCPTSTAPVFRCRSSVSSCRFSTNVSGQANWTPPLRHSCSTEYAMRCGPTHKRPQEAPMIDPPAQKDGGATILEIGQQPGAWREVAERSNEDVHAFLRELVNRPNLRVILTGAGSSAFVGEIAAPALRRHLGRRVEAIPTTSIVAGPKDYLERDTPTLMVSFGRSGNSPESVATTALADELVTEVWHLIYTCDRDGELARVHHDRANSRVVYMPERTNDTGFAMTSSLTSMLLSCLMMLGPADRDDADALARAAEYVAGLQSDIRELARAKKQRIVYLGSGS